ncbi:MAG: glycosyltransferase family 2 protein, partial [Anaerolineales bacterium]|nr:glycosyltransferase family 2 protein [Anaerolineales bacterium]
MTLFCSTIIPTIGRETLARAVESVLVQDFDPADHEVIVVNDSGRPLPAAAWQADARVRLLQTEQQEKSIARNTGAAAARGDYLHFLDDDDWLLPGALTALQMLAAQKPQAAWLYGRARFEDPQGKPVGSIYLNRDGNCFVQMVAGYWLPIQASLIRATVFLAAGAFNPAIHVTE